MDDLKAYGIYIGNIDINPLNWDITYEASKNSNEFLFFPSTEQEAYESVTTAALALKELQILALTLPGMYTPVDLPCSCPVFDVNLSFAIMHINDFHNWTREQIADWLDELADEGTINIDFGEL